jgi:hypothetical protein
MSEWVSVKEKLPDLIEGKDYSEYVLIATDDGEVMEAYYIVGKYSGWASCRQPESPVEGVRHWMIKPTPPN